MTVNIHLPNYYSPPPPLAAPGIPRGTHLLHTGTLSPSPGYYPAQFWVPTFSPLLPAAPCIPDEYQFPPSSTLHYCWVSAWQHPALLPGCQLTFSHPLLAPCITAGCLLFPLPLSSTLHYCWVSTFISPGNTLHYSVSPSVTLHPCWVLPLPRVLPCTPALYPPTPPPRVLPCTPAGYPPSPVVSILLAVLTVSPNKQ